MRDLGMLVKDVNKILKDGEPGNITADKSRGFEMTGYSPQYVVDAMNKVFGLEGWGFEDIYNKIDKDGKEAVAHVKVWLRVPGMSVVAKSSTETCEEYANLSNSRVVERTAYGSKKLLEKTSYGDAKKSAQTDGLKKALSYFSIGNRAYHGKLEVKGY